MSPVLGGNRWYQGLRQGCPWGTPRGHRLPRFPQPLLRRAQWIFTELGGGVGGGYSGGMGAADGPSTHSQSPNRFTRASSPLAANSRCFTRAEFENSFCFEFKDYPSPLPSQVSPTVAQSYFSAMLWCEGVRVWGGVAFGLQRVLRRC